MVGLVQTENFKAIYAADALKKTKTNRPKCALGLLNHIFLLTFIGNMKQI